MYPNGNNPGNFGCNATDILGTPGLCGQAGPQSPLPHWHTPDALEQAFVVGDGSDARVGGCFNLIGEANNRVLPCYCFFTAARMNRTTSCDWLNAEWYKTAVGKVVVVVLLFALCFSLPPTFRARTGSSASTTLNLPWCPPPPRVQRS